MSPDLGYYGFGARTDQRPFATLHPITRDDGMLVLSRKVGERILVGKDVRITVVRVASGGVRIGVEAPDGTPVIREELLCPEEKEVKAEL